MTKKLLILLTCIFIIYTAKAQSDWEIYNKINKEVLENSKAYNYLYDLTSQIGHRFTGSINGFKGEEFVYNLFKEIGLDEVKYDSFEFDWWLRKDLKFSVSDKKKRSKQSINAAAFAFTPDKADVAAYIVDVGNGLEDDFISSAKKVKNNIVLCNTKLDTKQKDIINISNRAKADLAIKYGAKAIIFIDENEKGAIMAGKIGNSKNILAIPAINISKFDGLKLRDQCKTNKKLKADIKIENFNGPLKARNIIGIIKGSELSDEYIVIGGHLDSWDLGTGAMDNGLGAMEIVDMARTFKSLKLKTKRTLVFINFMGEEQFLFGSRNYVKKMLENNELGKVKIYLNYDITGNPIGYQTTSDEFKLLFDSAGTYFSRIDTVFKNKNLVKMGTSTDHQPFMLEGIPVLRPNCKLNLTRFDCYHSDCDRMDIINKQDMINEVRFSTMLIYTLANTKKLPSAFTSEETKNLMIKFNLKNQLKAFGDWKWEE